MLNTSQMRKHAQLLRERDKSPAAQARANEIEARAELNDAEAGRPAEVAASSAMVEDYPILGKVAREGGKIMSIQYPWLDADIARIEAAGVMMSFEFCHDPMAGLRQGELGRIWIGTREHGPRVQWDHGRGWIKLESRGNYGQNWSHGGNWSSKDKERYSSLSACAPDLVAIIGRE